MEEEDASRTIAPRKAQEPGCSMWTPILPPKANPENLTHTRNTIASDPPVGQTGGSPLAETGKS